MNTRLPSMVALRRSRLALPVLLLATLGAAPAVAQQQIRSEVPIPFNRYSTFDETVEHLRRLVAAYPNLLRMESIGRSAQGREIWLVTLSNPATGPAQDKPAMYIDGSIHANEVQATETVLYSIWYLASAHGQVPALTELVDRSVFHFIPCVNPDGRQDWFDRPHTPNSNRTGLVPTDNDSDGLVDEDGPEDLDGDGSIGSMWRRDVNGTHRRDPDDPRIFLRVEPPARGEWSFAGSEGVDNDGDGQINEDGAGGYDMNRNWPTDWQPDHIQQGAGAYPLCYPESRAIAEWLAAQPNIAAGQAYHNTGAMILRGPGASYRQGQYPQRDLAVYEQIAKAGEEMLPFYRSLVIFSDLYTVHGGFVNWLAESLGVVSFTNELWTDKRILQSGENPADDKARMRWTDRILFGQTFTDWTPYQHPELGEVLIGGGTKWSSRSPPPFMLEEECHRNFAFTMFHAQQMPKLAVERTLVTQLQPGLWEVTVEISNSGLIPTRTARAADKRIGLPDTLQLGVPKGARGARVVAAGPMQRFTDRTFLPVDFRPDRLMVEQGIPGRGRSAFRFLVEADEGQEVELRYRAEKATDLVATVVLAGAPQAAAAPEHR